MTGYSGKHEFIFFVIANMNKWAPKTIFMTSSTRECHTFLIRDEKKIGPDYDVYAGGVTDKNILRMEHINHLKGVQSSSQQ